MSSKGEDRASTTSLIEESYRLERTGDISTALKRAGKALAQARATPDGETVALALACLAHSHHHLGHYAQAQARAREALAQAPTLSQARTDALRILGSCAHEEGNLVAAEGFYHQAIDVARQLGYGDGLQSCLHSLSACVYIPRGQFELALAADEAALRLALDLDLAKVAWLPLATLGWVYWITGRRERALATVITMAAYVPPGSLAEGYYYCLRGDLAQDGDAAASAPALYARARAIADRVGDPGLNAELRVGLSRYYRATGNPSAAYNWAGDALKVAQRAGNRDLQGWALIERGRAAWEGSNLAQAESDLVAASAVLTPMEAHYDLARIYFLLAALHHAQQRPEAESLWLEAVTRIISGGYAFLLEKERALAFPLLAAHLNSSEAAVATVSQRLLEQLARVPPPPLHVNTLGRFAVQQGRRAIPDQVWRPRRAGELFRLLLVSPQRTALKDQVLQHLWPRKSPGSAQPLFHQATSALRRALEPDLPEKFPSRYLSVDGGQVTLHLPEGSRLDFERFEEQVEQQAWETALTCYRGDLFPEDLYADWAAAPRERLRQRALRAALALAREAADGGRPGAALDACRRALAWEPWQEEAVLLGMEACLALNDRAAAIRLYRALARSLREELGIAPQASLQAFYRALSAT